MLPRDNKSFLNIRKPSKQNFSHYIIREGCYIELIPRQFQEAGDKRKYKDYGVAHIFEYPFFSGDVEIALRVETETIDGMLRRINDLRGIAF